MKSAIRVCATFWHQIKGPQIDQQWDPLRVCVCATVCGPHTTFNTVATLTALLTALLTAALTAQCVNAMSLEAVRQAGKLAKILSKGRQGRGVRERQGSSGRTEGTEGKRG